MAGAAALGAGAGLLASSHGTAAAPVPAPNAAHGATTATPAATTATPASPSRTRRYRLDAPIRELHLHPVQMERLYQTRLAAAGGHGEGKVASGYWIVELLTDDGRIGLGEVSDVEPAWQAPAVGELERFLRDALIGQLAHDRRLVERRVVAPAPRAWHPELRRMLAAAVDMALVDLEARAYDVPAYVLFGGLLRPRIDVTWVAFIRETALLEEEIRVKLDQGFRSFKLKVGDDFAADCEHVAAIRRLAGPRAHVRIDPSGSWDDAEAVEKIRHFASLGVDAVETPLAIAARNLAKEHPEQIAARADEVAQRLARLRAAVPVQLIEHVADFGDELAAALARHRAVDMFNICASQVGDLRRAQRLVHLAQSVGIDVLLGSTVELGIGTAASVHLAAASPGINVASDLVGPGLLVDDVTSPRFEYRRGSLAPPTGPGWGVALDRQKLAKYRPAAGEPVT